MKQKRKQKFVSTQIGTLSASRVEEEKAFYLAMRKRVCKICRCAIWWKIKGENLCVCVCMFLFISPSFYVSFSPFFFLCVFVSHSILFSYFTFPLWWENKRAICLWLNKKGNLSINSTDSGCMCMCVLWRKITIDSNRNWRNRFVMSV